MGPGPAVSTPHNPQNSLALQLELGKWQTLGIGRCGQRASWAVLLPGEKTTATQHCGNEPHGTAVPNPSSTQGRARPSMQHGSTGRPAATAAAASR